MPCPQKTDQKGFDDSSESNNCSWGVLLITMNALFSPLILSKAR